jgi:ATP-dependent exoDNAse (exonuclease V) alpha subunit
LTADGGASANACGGPGGFPDIVQLAIGMQVMITNNIKTELDVANGARGTVEKIIVALDNTMQLSNHIQTLTHPPCSVLVQLSRTKAKVLPGLDAGIIPITPIHNSFKRKLPDGKNVNLWQEQLPLTPAYAFTDYHTQGQTIPHVIIDLATPPSGGLTLFNAYVALSQSRTRRHAKLQRAFEDKLFQTPLNEYLVEEDARPEHLNWLSQQSMYT